MLSGCWRYLGVNMLIHHESKVYRGLSSVSNSPAQWVVARQDWEWLGNDNASGSRASGEVHCGLAYHWVLADPTPSILSTLSSQDFDVILLFWIISRSPKFSFICSIHPFHQGVNCLLQGVGPCLVGAGADDDKQAKPSHHHTEYPFWGAAPRLAPGGSSSLLPRYSLSPKTTPPILPNPIPPKYLISNLYFDILVRPLPWLMTESNGDILGNFEPRIVLVISLDSSP